MATKMPGSSTSGDRFSQAPLTALVPFNYSAPPVTEATDRAVLSVAENLNE